MSFSEGKALSGLKGPIVRCGVPCSALTNPAVEVVAFIGFFPTPSRRFYGSKSETEGARYDFRTSVLCIAFGSKRSIPPPPCSIFQPPHP
ncbi:hypothetical protein CDAR_271251 [Caerostris darwini]|uniref:Uncharacterized protein n=1 Tax=Caerostris darwini TaxID=1538125 RepID=A0AAV4TC07_9ARAC|nr:hypothetical protein CDAR_271251 [Caerostris darwini]